MERKNNMGCTSELLPSKASMSVGVAVITHSAKKHLAFCLPPLINSSLNPKVLVVNSTSNDGTVELANEMGAETLIIDRFKFNHGTTRELARNHLNTDIIVMITPDAYFLSDDGLDKLIEPLVNKKASCAYARQIPHDGASFFESFHRSFNYPEKSHIRNLEDMNKYGAYTFFCSNSCAAYLNSALSSIGGFESTLLGEDTVAVAKLLSRGHSIAYVAESVVKHSHRYTLKQEFQRHFDIGLARSQYDPSLFGAVSDASRGYEYVKQMFKSLLVIKPYLLPYGLLQTCIKYIAYLLGKKFHSAPTSLKKMMSSQDYYWDSIEFKKNH